MSQLDQPPPREGVGRTGGLLALGLLLLLYAGLALGSALQKSVTVDELGHLPSGLYYLQSGDARYSTLNPPLLNVLSALPVLLLDIDPTPEPPPPSDDVFSFWSNGYHFHERQRADYLRSFDAARCVPIALVAGLGLLVFLWGRRLAPQAPDQSGLLAAGFVCLSPNVLAQARLVGTDTGTALFVTLALFALRAMLRSPGLASSLLCGVALGLAQLTKFYALLLYPAFLVITLAWHAWSPEPRPQLRRLLACLGAAAVLSIVVLNAGYLGQEFGRSLSDLTLQSASLQGWSGSLLGGLPLPLPAAYLRAFDGQLVEIGSSMPSFLFGESFQGGRWYFYLALLAIKTPLGLLVAFGLAVFLSVARPQLPRHESLLLLTYPLLLFITLSLGSGRQLGVRALLSAVPLVWLWVAAGITRSLPRRWPSALAGAALLATLVATLWSWPDYLSFFNAFAGGRDGGYRYASDANIDVGQDLALLARYLEEQDVSSVQLLYFGSVDPALYGIDYTIPETRLEAGLLAVSVSLYHMRYAMYDHGRLRPVGPVSLEGLGEPVAKIAGSIHVYRIGPEPE